MHKFNRLLILLLVVLAALSLAAVTVAQDDDDDDDNSSESLDVNIAWQPFQNGVMLWFRSTDEVWVLIDDGTPFDGAGSVRYFSDSDESGGSGSTDCSISPIRGFGRVYFGNDDLRSQLGCPLADELGYNGNDSVASTGIVEVDGPGDTLYEVNRDGNTWLTVRFR